MAEVPPVDADSETRVSCAGFPASRPAENPLGMMTAAATVASRTAVLALPAVIDCSVTTLDARKRWISSVCALPPVS